MVLREQVRQTADIETIRPLNVAGYYCRKGIADSTFFWLEKAYEKGDIMLTRLRYYTWWDENLGSDPRYQDFLNKMNLAD